MVVSTCGPTIVRNTGRKLFVSETNDLMVLVDEGDRVVGTGEKLKTHREGALHRAFSVIVWNSRGRLLLQKRHAGKYHSGSLWTNACCGHPGPDEDVAAAAGARLMQEMGFSCVLEDLGRITYRAELDHGMIEHELVHVFRGVHDGAVTPDPQEADAFRWVTPDDLRADIAARPSEFSAWFRAYVDAGWPVTPRASGRPHD